MGFLTHLNTVSDALHVSSLGVTNATPKKWSEFSIAEQELMVQEFVSNNEPFIVNLVQAIRESKPNRDGSISVTFESKSRQFSTIELASLKTALTEIFPSLSFIDNTNSGLILKFSKNIIKGLSI